MKRKEQLEARARAIQEGREIIDKADAEKRGLTAEERQRVEAATKKATDITADLDLLDKQESAERALVAARLGEADPRVQDPGDPNDPMSPFKRALKMSARKLHDLTPEETDKVHFAVGEYVRAAVGTRGAISAEEKRDLLFSVDTQGGYLVPPQEFVATVIKFVMNLVFIRQRATKYTLEKAQSLGVPTLTADPSDANWTSEIAIGTKDTTMALGKRELRPHPLAKPILIAEPLLRMSAIDVAGLVMERIAYKFAVTEEKAFLVGTGAQQPLGIFTATPDGIDTSRDVNTGNTTTQVKFDGLLNAKYGLKPQYWPKASWLFNRTVIGAIAQLKDGDGRYLWQPSTQIGQADMLLGFPLMMSEYVPNTMTTGLYVGALGDWSFYWIVDMLDLRIQVMRELYAATNQIGFHARKEMDAMPVLAEAFVRVKLS